MQRNTSGVIVLVFLASLLVVSASGSVPEYATPLSGKTEATIAPGSILNYSVVVKEKTDIMVKFKIDTTAEDDDDELPVVLAGLTVRVGLTIEDPVGMLKGPGKLIFKDLPAGTYYITVRSASDRMLKFKLKVEDEDDAEDDTEKQIATGVAVGAVSGMAASGAALAAAFGVIWCVRKRRLAATAQVLRTTATEEAQGSSRDSGGYVPPTVAAPVVPTSSAV